MLKPLSPTVLSMDLLNQLNKHYISTQYKHLRTPLLQYTPEAIVTYAVIIYDYVILPAGLAPNTTQEDYINYLTKTYREAIDTITPALEDFIGQLEAIVAEPQYTQTEGEPHSISEYINYFKTGTDTPDGYNQKHFPALHDFFYSVTSPLATYPYVTDRRINAIKYEANSLQRRHSERLTIFIREELLILTDQLRELKDMPTDTNPKNDDKPLTGYVLPPDVEVILEKFLAEANAKAQAEAQARLKQAESNAKAEARIKEIQAQQARKEPRTLAPEEYLELFISSLEPHYTSLSSKYTSLHIENSNNVARLDEYFAYIHAVKYANSNNLDLNTVLAQQSQGQAVILDFNELKPILWTCIQCYLYNLAPQDVLSPTVIEHGVVKGILEATARSAPDIARRSYRPNAELAKALYDKILEHTHGFTTVLPLPEVAPQTAEAIKIRVKELIHRESVPKGNILPFDLTKPLAQVIHEMQADTITAFTEVLSAKPDPKSLVPVNITTIKDMAYLLIGRACTPYLLNGDLVIHDQAADTYYKIIPTIDKENYAAYGFRVCNFQNLSSRIYRQQTLLMTSDKYKDRYFDNEEPYSDLDDPFNEPSKNPKTVSEEDLGHIKYKPLPQGDPQARQEALAELEEWDKVLTDRINDVFEEPDYDEVHAKAQAEYRQNVSSLQYFYRNVVFISAHKLAAYVYFPQEYSDLIIRKPLDPETGKPLVYHPHHKDGNRSNNRKENLEIISKQLNDELRSTSRPVIYQGKHYNTLKSYCEATHAGNYKNLQQVLGSMETIDPTDLITYNSRLYTLEAGIITATDNTTAPIITYNSTTYTTLKDFAEANKLPYKSLHNAVSKARKDNKTNFKYKYFNFYLDEADNIIISK
ncbi:HNH endonuclease [Clostridium faecium]|uniref:HNH endonuclease n=1 Tax=Clostridium faecium TaxID=2762223 RepID=A0ABR8YV68_9CLOT|nr:HNH endonuclease [Clostridium faecium]MBD8048130.1 HNH endonuclease [Clostridium faecium]